ncbi:MAG: SUMF1/EgtB/PvdO family nonheme iron enzyme [Alphaproteobacteria bacterium]|nr:SUMF1/EgtB/PvdO family nonheme iron enzyme [Alphaproteobacteria bacterium]
MFDDEARFELALTALLEPAERYARPPTRLARRLWRAQAQPYLKLTLPDLPEPDAPEVPEGMAWIEEREVVFKQRMYPVKGFAMDRTPVTNAQWQAFVNATDEAPPPYWLGDRPAPHLHDHPVVGITLEQAQAYAAWRGVRLPTVLEWAAAALGEWSGRRFPWGFKCDKDTCNCPEFKPRETTPVDAHRNSATPEGVLDLYGNTWEWTLADPRCPQPASGRTWVMGGSYDQPCQADKALPMAELPVDHDALNLGFRCAADVGEVEQGFELL